MILTYNFSTIIKMRMLLLRMTTMCMGYITMKNEESNGGSKCNESTECMMGFDCCDNCMKY